MLRRYLCLGVFCASLMFCLARNFPLTHALWRLSFVPEAAARTEPFAVRSLAPRSAPAPGTSRHTQR